jgi:hypothetical protein
MNVAYFKILPTLAWSNWENHEEQSGPRLEYEAGGPSTLLQHLVSYLFTFFFRTISKGWHFEIKIRVLKTVHGYAAVRCHLWLLSEKVLTCTFYFCTEFTTEDKLEYQFSPVTSGALHFKVRAANDAHIALTSGPAEGDPMYEVGYILFCACLFIYLMIWKTLFFSVHPFMLLLLRLWVFAFYLTC